jgi:hypothetical protein
MLTSCKHHVEKLIYVNQLNEKDTIVVKYEYLNDSFILKKNLKYNSIDTIIKKDQQWYIRFNGKNQIIFNEKYFNEGKAVLIKKSESFCGDCVIHYKYVPKYKFKNKNFAVYAYDVFEISGIHENYSEYLTTIFFNPIIGEIRNTDIYGYSEYELPDNAFDYILLKIKYLNNNCVEFKMPERVLKFKQPY